MDRKYYNYALIESNNTLPEHVKMKLEKKSDLIKKKSVQTSSACGRGS